jgi:PPK2 family polyphosphate:nucleotide phosphotransferase
MRQSLNVRPGRPVYLKDFEPAYTGAVSSKQRAAKELEANLEVLDNLGYRLYAENRRALLLVLQGMDSAGKDGTIRKVMRGFNPQSCQVTSFKQPSAHELAHDFLWRIHRAVPNKGFIGIFNRSQYEDVLVVRVHKLVPKSEWETRYERINMFEKLLVEGGVTIVKVFLHISKEEQRKRLQARLDDRTKRWKFDSGDLKERELWDEYQRAYEAALTRCNTKWAPWNIVPADHKWYRNLVVSRILRKTLEKMAPCFPPEEKGFEGLVIE